MKNLKRAAALILLFFHFTLLADTNSFNDFPTWEFECSTLKIATKKRPKPDQELQKFKILWHRDEGRANVTWENGNGKGLREIPGFSENRQLSAHFWMSPYTSKYTGQETTDSSHGFWVESFGPTMYSIRFSGEIAVTNHDIIYGGMEAFSEHGTCTLKGRMN